MATRNGNPAPARAFVTGPIAGIRIAPGATTVAGCLEAWGIKSITRNGAGDYTVVVLGKGKGAIPQVTVNAADTTLFHEARVILQTDSTQTFRIVHRSVAFASVASGNALSDSFVSLDVVFHTRAE